jgi:hypothetical protein
MNKPQIVILYTEHQLYGWGWHVQWTKNGRNHQEFHPSFEAVSRLVEGSILA